MPNFMVQLNFCKASLRAYPYGLAPKGVPLLLVQTLLRKLDMSGMAYQEQSLLVQAFLFVYP
jgi:hypothetical protein